MSRSSAFYLVDIFIAADKIKRYTQSFSDAKSFLYSEIEWDATVRELEIIGEATKHLLQDEMIDPRHRIIVDFRNHIVHAYFGIDEQIVWEVVHQFLDPFIAELHLLVAEQGIDLSKAIDRAREDYHYSGKILEFLNTL